MGKKIDLTGLRFGRLTVLEDSGQRKSNHVVWRCRCDCGNEKLVSSQHLKNGSVSSCGCAVYAANKRKIIDISGQRYGMLVPMEPTDRRSGNTVIWKCKCDCGNICFVSAANLKCGGTTSCGCFSSAVHRESFRSVRTEHVDPFYVDGTNVRSIANKRPSRSNTSGVVGVSFDKSINSWRADIIFKGVRYRLGARKDKTEAIALRKEAEKRIHGDFLKWYAEEYPDLWEKIKKSES